MDNKPVIAYTRVSTQDQANSGLGLEAQRAVIDAETSRRGWSEVIHITDHARSGKNLDRPGITEALELLRAGAAGTLVVAKLDRLSRSLADFCRLMDTAKAQGWQLVVLDLAVDTSTASGRLMADVMASFASYERAMASQRTKEALAAKKSQGFRLGRPVTLDRQVAQRIVTMRQQGMSTPKIAAALTADGTPTATGGKWWPSTVSAVLRSAELDAQAAA